MSRMCLFTRVVIVVIMVNTLRGANVYVVDVLFAVAALFAVAVEVIVCVVLNEKMQKNVFSSSNQSDD